MRRKQHWKSKSSSLYAIGLGAVSMWKLRWFVGYNKFYIELLLYYQLFDRFLDHIYSSINMLVNTCRLRIENHVVSLRPEMVGDIDMTWLLREAGKDHILEIYDWFFWDIVDYVLSFRYFYVGQVVGFSDFTLNPSRIEIGDLMEVGRLVSNVFISSIKVAKSVLFFYRRSDSPYVQILTRYETILVDYLLSGYMNVELLKQFFFKCFSIWYDINLKVEEETFEEIMEEEKKERSRYFGHIYGINSLIPPGPRETDDSVRVFDKFWYKAEVSKFYSLLISNFILNSFYVNIIYYTVVSFFRVANFFNKFCRLNIIRDVDEKIRGDKYDVLYSSIMRRKSCMESSSVVLVSNMNFFDLFFSDAYGVIDQFLYRFGKNLFYWGMFYFNIKLKNDTDIIRRLRKLYLLLLLYSNSGTSSLFKPNLANVLSYMRRMHSDHVKHSHISFNQSRNVKLHGAPFDRSDLQSKRLHSLALFRFTRYKEILYSSFLSYIDNEYFSFREKLSFIVGQYNAIYSYIMRNFLFRTSGGFLKKVIKNNKYLFYLYLVNPNSVSSFSHIQRYFLGQINVCTRYMNIFAQLRCRFRRFRTVSDRHPMLEPDVYGKMFLSYLIENMSFFLKKYRSKFSVQRYSFVNLYMFFAAKLSRYYKLSFSRSYKSFIKNISVQSDLFKSDMFINESHNLIVLSQIYSNVIEWFKITDTNVVYVLSVVLKKFVKLVYRYKLVIKAIFQYCSGNFNVLVKHVIFLLKCLKNLSNKIMALKYIIYNMFLYGRLCRMDRIDDIQVMVGCYTELVKSFKSLCIFGNKFTIYSKFSYINNVVYNKVCNYLLLSNYLCCGLSSYNGVVNLFNSILNFRAIYSMLLVFSKILRTSVSYQVSYYIQIVSYLYRKLNSIFVFSKLHNNYNFMTRELFYVNDIYKYVSFKRELGQRGNALVDIFYIKRNIGHSSNVVLISWYESILGRFFSSFNQSVQRCLSSLKDVSYKNLIASIGYIYKCSSLLFNLHYSIGAIQATISRLFFRGRAFMLSTKYLRISGVLRVKYLSLLYFFRYCLRFLCILLRNKIRNSVVLGNYSVFDFDRVGPRIGLLSFFRFNPFEGYKYTHEVKVRRKRIRGNPFYVRTLYHLYSLYNSLFLEKKWKLRDKIFPFYFRQIVKYSYLLSVFSRSMFVSKAKTRKMNVHFKFFKWLSKMKGLFKYIKFRGFFVKKRPRYLSLDRYYPQVDFYTGFLERKSNVDLGHFRYLFELNKRLYDSIVHKRHIARSRREFKAKFSIFVYSATYYMYKYIYSIFSFKFMYNYVYILLHYFNNVLYRYSFLLKRNFDYDAIRRVVFPFKVSGCLRFNNDVLFKQMYVRSKLLRGNEIKSMVQNISFFKESKQVSLFFSFFKNFESYVTCYNVYASFLLYFLMFRLDNLCVINNSSHSTILSLMALFEQFYLCVSFMKDSVLPDVLGYYYKLYFVIKDILFNVSIRYALYMRGRSLVFKFVRLYLIFVKFIYRFKGMSIYACFLYRDALLNMHNSINTYKNSVNVYSVVYMVNYFYNRINTNWSRDLYRVTFSDSLIFEKIDKLYDIHYVEGDKPRGRGRHKGITYKKNLRFLLNSVYSLYNDQIYSDFSRSKLLSISKNWRYFVFGFDLRFRIYRSIRYRYDNIPKQISDSWVSFLLNKENLWNIETWFNKSLFFLSNINTHREFIDKFALFLGERRTKFFEDYVYLLILWCYHRYIEFYLVNFFCCTYGVRSIVYKPEIYTHEDYLDPPIVDTSFIGKYIKTAISKQDSLYEAISEIRVWIARSVKRHRERSYFFRKGYRNKLVDYKLKYKTPIVRCVKIEISGRVTDRRRTIVRVFKVGLKTTTSRVEHRPLDYESVQGLSKYGTYGIKIWVFYNHNLIKGYIR